MPPKKNAKKRKNSPSPSEASVIEMDTSESSSSTSSVSTSSASSSSFRSQMQMEESFSCSSSSSSSHQSQMGIMARGNNANNSPLRLPLSDEQIEKLDKIFPRFTLETLEIGHLLGSELCSVIESYLWPELSNSDIQSTFTILYTYDGNGLPNELWGIFSQYWATCMGLSKMIVAHDGFNNNYLQVLLIKNPRSIGGNRAISLLRRMAGSLHNILPNGYGNDEANASKVRPTTIRYLREPNADIRCTQLFCGSCCVALLVDCTPETSDTYQNIYVYTIPWNVEKKLFDSSGLKEEINLRTALASQWKTDDDDSVITHLQIGYRLLGDSSNPDLYPYITYVKEYEGLGYDGETFGLWRVQNFMFWNFSQKKPPQLINQQRTKSEIMCASGNYTDPRRKIIAYGTDKGKIYWYLLSPHPQDQNDLSLSQSGIYQIPNSVSSVRLIACDYVEITQTNSYFVIAFIQGQLLKILSMLPPPQQPTKEQMEEQIKIRSIYSLDYQPISIEWPIYHNLPRRVLYIQKSRNLFIQARFDSSSLMGMGSGKLNILVPPDGASSQHWFGKNHLGQLIIDQYGFGSLSLATTPYNVDRSVLLRGSPATKLVAAGISDTWLCTVSQDTTDELRIRPYSYRDFYFDNDSFFFKERVSHLAISNDNRVIALAFAFSGLLIISLEPPNSDFFSYSRIAPLVDPRWDIATTLQALSFRQIATQNNPINYVIAVLGTYLCFVKFAHEGSEEHRFNFHVPSLEKKYQRYQGFIFGKEDDAACAWIEESKIYVGAVEFTEENRRHIFRLKPINQIPCQFPQYLVSFSGENLAFAEKEDARDTDCALACVNQASSNTSPRRVPEHHYEYPFVFCDEVNIVFSVGLASKKYNNFDVFFDDAVSGERITKKCINKTKLDEQWKKHTFLAGSKGLVAGVFPSSEISQCLMLWTLERLSSRHKSLRIEKVENTNVLGFGKFLVSDLQLSPDAIKPGVTKIIAGFVDSSVCIWEISDDLTITMIYYHTPRRCQLAEGISEINTEYAMSLVKASSTSSTSSQSSSSASASSSSSSANASYYAASTSSLATTVPLSTSRFSTFAPTNSNNVAVASASAAAISSAAQTSDPSSNKRQRL